ncbi:DUF4184 family protein [soil metagenome]
MPFTPAHPAILFPFRWLKPDQISWTALIIGSLAPDMEYFLWMNPGAHVSHTLLGILVFNLPVTILLAFVWHGFLREVMMRQIPFIKTKYRNLKNPDFQLWMQKHWMVFFISALIGIISHLVWDSFCHAKGYMTLHIPLLIEHVNLAGHQIRLCYVLWYIFSAIGFAGIIITVIDYRSFTKAEVWKQFWGTTSFWAKVLFVSSLLAITRMAFGLGWNWFRHLVIISIAGLIYGIIIVSWLEFRKSRLLVSR